MQSTMAHADVSILIPSLTDFVAFAIGSSTVLTALQAYSLFSAFGAVAPRDAVPVYVAHSQ